MNSGKAKRIRKKVYGEMSSRNPQYKSEDHISLTKIKGKLKRIKTSTLVCIGLRAEYLRAKKEMT